MVETPRDIKAIFDDGRLIDQAMLKAAWEALRVHREAGQPLAIWRDGRVAWVSPDEFERGLRADDSRPERQHRSAWRAVVQPVKAAGRRGSPRGKHRPGDPAHQGY